MENFKKKLNIILDSKLMHCALFIISALALFLLVFYSFSAHVWADEAYSIKVAQHSWGEIIAFSADDVHPPLYYLILKLFLEIAVLFSKSAYVTFAVAKLVSALPFIILVPLCWHKINASRGVKLTALLCLWGMPLLYPYGVEIRMYSCGLLFVTVSFLYAKEIIYGKIRLKSWIMLVIFSVCSAYIHTFSLISMASIWLLLLIYILRFERTLLKKYWISASAVVVSFLPWFFVLLRQLGRVSGEYWIEPIGKDVYMGLIVSLIRWALLYYLLTVKHISSKEKYSLAFGLLVPFITVLFGVVASLLLRPVFILRYAVPSLLCVGISVVLISDKCHVVLRAGVTALLVVCSLVNVIGFALYEDDVKFDAGKAIEFSDSIEDDAVIIVARHGHLADAAAVTMPDNLIYSYGKLGQSSATPHYGDVFDNQMVFEDIGAVQKWLDEGVPVYYIEHNEAWPDQRLPENDEWGKQYITDCVFQMDCKVYKITAE